MNSQCRRRRLVCVHNAHNPPRIPRNSAVGPEVRTRASAPRTLCYELCPNRAMVSMTTRKNEETNTKSLSLHSVLDSLRSPRATRTRTTGRKHQNLHLHPDRPRRRQRHLRFHPPLRGRSAKHDEQGVAGGDERIHEGKQQQQQQQQFTHEGSRRVLGIYTEEKNPIQTNVIWLTYPIHFTGSTNRTHNRGRR